MAEFARKSSTQVSGELGENGESGAILDDGTRNGGGVAYNSRSMSSPAIVIHPPRSTSDTCTVDNNSFDGGALEDTSCGGAKKKKRDKRNKMKMSSKVVESEGIKGGGAACASVSAVAAELGEGCALSNSACKMERVNSSEDFFTYDRSRSPYICSEIDWEASDHSDTDADHSDSSDDDNPTSQVDRMIERGARLIMDGENSNLSSETDDTDNDFSDDSDSDITDVSPLVSNSASPLGMSPVVSRRNLMSSLNQRPPFMRHYSHRGHDGDVEDEGDEENVFKDDLFPLHEDTHPPEANKMSFVVQALLKLSMEEGQQDSHPTEGSHPQPIPTKYRHNLCPTLVANPHHRHLRKSSNRRKNMSFSNEEVRVINRDNGILLEKLLAVDNREDLTHNRATQKQSNAGVNRRRQEESIRKDNLALLRRLQETKPSKGIANSSLRNSSSNHHHHNSHHHHHHHSGSQHHHHRHHHKSSHHHHQSAARSCSISARQSHGGIHATAFSPPHHSPKETAL